MTKKIIVRLISTVVTLLLGVLINYLALPAWTIRSGGFWGYAIVMLLVMFASYGIGDLYLYETEYEEFKPIPTIISGGITALGIIALIICSLTGTQVFNADYYQSLIEIKEGNFSTDITEVSDTNIPIVDVGTAQRLGDRTIGTINNTSWYEVDDEYNLIIFNGKNYRVSALNYGGLLKYRKAKNIGIPGYVLVDAVTQEAKYVETEKPIMYSPSAHFGNKLKRHLRKKYPSYIFDSCFFEIDEQGNPYYIVSVMSPKIGVFKPKVVTSFILIDACTGECTEYRPEELPEWVDHAYSMDYLSDMAYYNLEFVNGYWNHLGSKTGILRTTYSYKNSEFSGYNSIVSKEGVVFYTGLTPANGAESNVGFITLNPKTGTIKKYNCAGAEESSAQAAAEGLVQNLGYVATFPNIINVNGIATYFMVLKDIAGLIQRYALCNVTNYAEVVEANTLEEAVKLYTEKIGSTDVEKTEYPETVEVTGKIETLYEAEIDGNTYFYYILEGNEYLFMSSIKNANKQVTLKVGDTVTLTYSETSENGVYNVSKITF